MLLIMKQYIILDIWIENRMIALLMWSDFDFEIIGNFDIVGMRSCCEMLFNTRVTIQLICHIIHIQVCNDYMRVPIR